MGRYFTVNEILNRAGSEIGLTPVTDPVSDASFQQLRYLLDSAGQEMVIAWNWPVLVKEHQITTAAIDSGDYDLPDDFSHMIPQTHWDRSNDVPLAGPLSAQDWTYLLGRDLVNNTIYASFRQKDGKFSIFPQPPPDGLDINFEYISRNWLRNTAGDTFYDVIQEGTNVVLLEPILMIKLLKAKYLEAKGFDSTAARRELGYTFDSLTGKAEDGSILNASGIRDNILLDAWRNVPDTGYGS